MWSGWIHLDVRKLWWNHKDPSYLELLGQYRYTDILYISAGALKAARPQYQAWAAQALTVAPTATWHARVPFRSCPTRLISLPHLVQLDLSSDPIAQNLKSHFRAALAGSLLQGHKSHTPCDVMLYILLQVSSSALLINNFTPSCKAAVIVIASGRTVLLHSWDQTWHARAIPIRRWSNVLQHLQG